MAPKSLRSGPQAAALVVAEPNWCEEELMLAAPYSHTRTWERILEGQHLSGRSKFTGPPGMRATVVAHMEAEGIEAASERFANSIMQNGEPYRPG